MAKKITAKKTKPGTTTSSLGTNGRINHDSSKFYDSSCIKRSIMILK